MQNHFEIEIDATPERVFHWLDDPERVMQWAENVVENENLHETANKVGSTFRQVYDENGRRMEFMGEVLAYEKDRRLHITMTSKMFDLDVDYELVGIDGDGTRLVQDSTVSWKGMMKLIGPIMCKFMAKSGQDCMEKDFGRLKHLAETSAEPVPTA